MPICTTCTNYAPFIYTVYESAYNLRLEECVKCHAFVDPYVEHDSLTLLLDLILLKRGVYRHLLYNRGSEPRKATNDGKDTVPISPRQDNRERRRWIWVFKLGVVLIFLDAYIRWCHLNPNPPLAGSPWTLDLFTHSVRVLLGCVAGKRHQIVFYSLNPISETIAFHSGVGLMCHITLALLSVIPYPKAKPAPSDIRREFRLSLIPLTLFYSSLTKLFLLYLLTIWRPSTVSIPPPSFGAAFTLSNATWNEYARRAFIALDDDKIDKEWFIRNIVGGMSAGFGLRVILDAHPLLTTLVVIVGWAFKTLVSSMISHWVGGSERTVDAWLAYSIP